MLKDLLKLKGPLVRTMKYQLLPAAALVLLLFMFISIYWADKGYRDLALLRADYRAVQYQNHQIEFNNKEIRRKIHRLKHDARYLEAVTRQQLGGIRESELIFKISGE